MACQPLSIELKDCQENASFCIGVCPGPSFEVGYVAARRQVNHVATRPSVILFHGCLDKGTTSEHKREIRARNMQLLVEVEEMNHEERMKSSHVSEDIDSDSQAKQKAVSPELSCYEANEECGCNKKRHRTSYDSFQLKRLEEEFGKDNYIIGMKRWRLSDELEIPEKQIKIWFQNRRTKSKKHCNSKACRHASSKEHPGDSFESRGYLG